MSDTWIFADRYRVDAPIGSGGMGAVWSGYDQQLDRRVAIKLMHQPTTPAFVPGSPEAGAVSAAVDADRERFLREIRTTARLELPGIPAVYDFGVDPATGRIYLVMQLLYGQTLADLIASRDYAVDPWPISWAAATAAQVAATLTDVHRVDVVHRDIKPSNLMVGTNGLVKVLDFGVAILQGASALPKLTQIGITVGSPPYMSREQVLGNPVGPASDVYALGCVLHEMVTGRVPFVETSSRSYQDHHANTPPSPLSILRPDAPPALDDLVLAMLAKAPGDRPEADAVYDALLPLIRADAPVSDGERDPRRPFLRPLGPALRRDGSPATVRPTPTVLRVLSIDEALEIQERVGKLVEDSQLQQAIDVLDDAVARAQDQGVVAEMRIALATTLFVADEFTRAARVFEDLLPGLSGRDDLDQLAYYAGVSNAEIGDLPRAIRYLRSFLARAGVGDPLYRDAKYQVGMMLPAIGEPQEGLRELSELRAQLTAEFGETSIHVRTLDRRIANIRDSIDQGNRP